MSTQLTTFARMRISSLLRTALVATILVVVALVVSASSHHSGDTAVETVTTAAASTVDAPASAIASLVAEVSDIAASNGGALTVCAIAVLCCLLFRAWALRRAAVRSPVAGALHQLTSMSLRRLTDVRVRTPRLEALSISRT